MPNWIEVMEEMRLEQLKHPDLNALDTVRKYQ